MSFRTIHVQRPEQVTRYVDVTCDDCGDPLPPEHPQLLENGEWSYLQVDGGLHLKLSGGYGEFIDVGPYGQEPNELPMHVVLCSKCAIKLVEAVPYLKARVAQHLSMHVGHHCLDGTIHWDPMSECPLDPDRHGWRRVYEVLDTNHRQLAWFDTKEEADAFLAHPPLGVVVPPDAYVYEAILANVKNRASRA